MLGAGNQAFLGLYDAIHTMFHDGHVACLKFHDTQARPPPCSRRFPVSSPISVLDGRGCAARRTMPPPGALHSSVEHVTVTHGCHAIGLYQSSHKSSGRRT